MKVQKFMYCSQTYSHLICLKSCVAPVKSLTVPCLDLLGNFLTNRLTHFCPVLRFIQKPAICFARAKQMTCFYIKCNFGLKRINEISDLA